MQRACQDVSGFVQEEDDGDRTNLLGAIVEEEGIPKVRSESLSGVATDAPSESARRGSGVQGPPPPPPWGRPNITRSLSQNFYGGSSAR